MNKTKARDTLKVVNKAVKYGILTNSDLTEIALIVNRRIEKL